MPDSFLNIQLQPEQEEMFYIFFAFQEQEWKHYQSKVK